MYNRYGKRKYINLTNLVKVLDSIISIGFSEYVNYTYNKLTRELSWHPKERYYRKFEITIPESVKCGYSGHYLLTEDYVKVVLNFIDKYSEEFTDRSIRRLLFHLPDDEKCTGISELEEKIDKIKILVELLR